MNATGCCEMHRETRVKRATNQMLARMWVDKITHCWWECKMAQKLGKTLWHFLITPNTTIKLVLLHPWAFISEKSKLNPTHSFQFCHLILLFSQVCLHVLSVLSLQISGNLLVYSDASASSLKAACSCFLSAAKDGLSHLFFQSTFLFNFPIDHAML